MAEIKEILYPVNFQNYSFIIFEKILGFKRFGVEKIILLHFIDVERCLDFLNVEFREKIIEDWKKLAVEKLKEYEKRAYESGVTTEIIVIEGNPRWEILKIADKYNVDAIITGFQGTPKYSGGYLDPNSELILRSCKYPAFVFRGSENINPETDKIYDFNRILYPTDFSDFSFKVMAYLPIFPKGGIKRIDVIHVQDENLFKHLTSETINFYNEKDKRRMVKLEEDLKNMGFVEVNTRILKGIPFSVILEDIKREPETLLILGSRGKSSSFQMLFGSTAERIARMSRSPVLII